MNESSSPELDKLFKNLYNEDEINVYSVKIRILKDFLTRLPYMLEKACTVDNIIGGFVDVVMLDNKHKVWPDLDKIISTRRKNITKKEKNLDTVGNK
eukprot:13492839-Ditylum_brightwellii.AAC.1